MRFVGEASWRVGSKVASAAGQVRSVIQRLIAAGSMIAEADGSTHDIRGVSISGGEGEALTRWVLQEKARAASKITVQGARYPESLERLTGR